MQQSKAIIIGSAIIGACILAYLGYTISRDRAVAEAERQEQEQQHLAQQQAHYNRLKEELHDLRLKAYERQLGRIERIKLEAFEYGVRADGVEKACRDESTDPRYTISAERCDALEKNLNALFADGESTFVRPPAH
jgi:glycine/D-amino acid oxidase-like deaminating enzyme